ncbi:hypothetical protein AUQ37_06225 [Candidatus Methanomethylophilus sp. 1R26]|nr:hypothetical protein AUQ37_06225 [Candidatus Methanomethylophilus sp. 1R26]
MRDDSNLKATARVFHDKYRDLKTSIIATHAIDNNDQRFFPMMFEFFVFAHVNCASHSSDAEE